MTACNIRPVESAELIQVQTFLESLYQKDPNLVREHFRWKMLENPYSPRPLVIVVEDQGQVVGTYGYTPLKWVNSGSDKEEIILAPGGAFVSPDHRGRGLFGRMMEVGRDWLGSDYRWFLNTTATSSSASSYEKFGAYPLFPRRFFDFCSLPGILHYCLYYRKTTPSRVRLGEFNGIMVSDRTLSSEMAEIAGARFLREPGAELKRDLQFYNWRYRNPFRRYTFYYAGRPGAITGFVVVSHSDNNLRGYIIDYGESREGELSRILSFIHERGDFDVLSIYEICVDPAMARALDALKLRRNRTMRLLEQRVFPLFPFYLIKTSPGEEGWFWEGLDLRSPKSWSMMGAARELE